MMIVFWLLSLRRVLPDEWVEPGRWVIAGVVFLNGILIGLETDARTVGKVLLTLGPRSPSRPLLPAPPPPAHSRRGWN